MIWNRNKKDDSENGDGILSYFPLYPDVVQGAYPWMKGKFFSAFPAVEERNFRIYFTGQLVSMIGTWLQTVAQGWLVYELTHSAFWVGTATALTGLPVLFFGVFGGVIVDRFPQKRVLFWTQVLPMLFAAILGTLAIFEMVTLFYICALAFLLGLVTAIEMPARHAFISSLVERKNLASAVALQSAAVNVSRIIGPSIAGLLIAVIGVGGTFLINAASFLAVIISLKYITLPEQEPRIHERPIRAVKDGLRYSFGNPGIRIMLFYTGIVSIFGWSFVSILPAVTSEVFHSGADGLGYLYSAIGVGAIVAAVLVSIFYHAFGPRTFIIGGNLVLVASLVTFSYTSNITWGLAALFFSGLALIGQFSVLNTTLQHHVADQFRGRVMSIYSAFLRGMVPIGSFTIGYLADKRGSPAAIRWFAIACLAGALLALLNLEKIPRSALDEEQ